MLDLLLLPCDSVEGVSVALAGPGLGDEPEKIIAIAGGILLAGLMATLFTIRQISIGRAREQSRREIAAYVAEGSMSAEEGERLLSAGRTDWGCTGWQAETAAWSRR